MARGPAGMRRVLHLVAAACLALGGLAMGGAAAGEDIDVAAFQPPADEQLLTRTLRRGLPGGAEVVTRRSYEVRFVRDGDGYRIDGRPLAASVEAPPALASLAEIERTRVETGLFPIRLDARGMILPGGPTASGDAVERASGVVQASLAGSGLAALDMLQAQAFVRQIRQRPARSQWPDDLFRPALARPARNEPVELGEGMRGSVTIEEVARCRANGMLSSFERTVTTDLGGDKRVTSEEWTLADMR